MLAPKKYASTVEAIYDGYTLAAEDGFRPHLGASIIGRPCARQLWYVFRWARKADHPGRILRLFNTGFREEERLLKELASIPGAQVYGVDPQTGEQFRFTAVNGHFGGSMDGCGYGLPESAMAWMGLEFKTHSAKSFARLLSEGLESHKPEHYAQIQVYMHLAGLPRFLYIAVCKDTDDLWAKVFEYDQARAEQLLARAERIINATDPCEPISRDPSWYQCKFCDYSQVCYAQEIPAVNCRTCAHSTPVADGQWQCERLDGKPFLAEKAQKAGCPQHVYIPSLLPYQPMDGNQEQNWIRYQTKDGREFYNGDQMTAGMYVSDVPMYSSKELREIPEALLCNDGVEQLRVTFR